MALRAYLRKLLTDNELKRIITPVDADQELAALCRREYLSGGGGDALLFEAVRGTGIQVAANLFGSKKRLLQMLNLDEKALIEKIRALICSGEQDAAGNLSFVCNKHPFAVAAAQFIQSNYTLRDIPALRSWPGEKDRYLTLAMTHTVCPVTGACNLGLYRAAVVGDQEIALNFAPGSGADDHLKMAEERDEPLPVALIIGADPALYWAAAAPLPPGCSEYGFAAAITGRTVNFAPCLTQPLKVPASAEIIIEGEIMPGKRVSEGPFGNHTGQYVGREDCPLIKVTAIRHRSQPILPVTVVGPPPSENVQLAKLNELLLREMLCCDFSLISDLVIPEMTAFHGVTIIAVRKCSTTDVADLIKKLTSLTFLGKSRLLVLVDDDINIHDLNTSWWRAVNMLSPDRVISSDRGLIINATGINRDRMVIEDRGTTVLVEGRHYEISKATPEQSGQ
jgi:4-hydroxy-3-polyprenylbenzoate decarboxylase